MSQYIINPFFQFGDQPPQTRNAWVEIARKTLVGGETSFVLTPDPFPKKRYLMVLLSIEGQADVAVDCELRFNGDSGSNYGNRISTDGGADAISTNTSILDTFGFGGTPAQIGFVIFFIDNNPNGEKIIHKYFVSRTALGPATAPRRQEQVSKWVNALDQINSITFFRNGVGSFAFGEAVLLGFDPTDGLEATANFWQELADVNADGVGGFSVPFTAKKYLWVQGYFIPSVSSIGFATFNGDVGVKYADRSSTNGLADGTTPSAVRFFISGTFTTPSYYEAFIINIANKEKLIIAWTVNQNAVGSASVPARYEIVNKWTDVVAQISSIDFFPTVGNYFPSSKVKVWGHD